MSVGCLCTHAGSHQTTSLRGHRTSHCQFHKQECRITGTWTPQEDSCWRVTMPCPSYLCCLLSQRAGKSLKTSNHHFQGLQNRGGEERMAPRQKLKDTSAVFTREKHHQFSVIFSLPFPKTPKSRSIQPFPELVWQERILWSQMSPDSAARGHISWKS